MARNLVLRHSFTVSFISFVLALAFLADRSKATPSCDDEGEESVLLQISKSSIDQLHTAKATGEIKVLDVSGSRTGSQSKTAALQRLGYSPCHAGQQTAVVRPTLCNYIFHNNTRANLEDVKEMMGSNGWDAGLDEPFNLIYEDVMLQFPDSKFILTEREPEDWFHSTEHFFNSQPAVWSLFRYFADHPSVSVPDGIADWEHMGCMFGRYWGCDFYHPTNATKQACMQGYKAHVERVKEVIPPERLLLFKLDDMSYEKLAPFLGKEVPTFPNGTVEPFPDHDYYTEEVTWGLDANKGNPYLRQQAM
jgi:hypothetical protein